MKEIKSNTGGDLYKLMLAFATGAVISLVMDRLIHKYRYKSEVMEGIPDSAVQFHQEEAERKSSESYKWL